MERNAPAQQGAEAGPVLPGGDRPLKSPHWSSRTLSRRAINVVASLFSPARNSVYQAPDLARAVLTICLNRASAERSTRPSPDTVLRRLGQIDEKSLQEILERENRKLVGELNLPRRPVMAVDYRTLPYYGRDQPALVRDSELPGTTRGVRFAMLSVVESGKSIALRVRQVTPLDTHVGVLRELLRNLPRKPRLLLLDRGFYSVEVVLALKSMGVHFLMPAPRTPGIKRACEAFERGERPALSRYTMRGQCGKAEVWLVLDRRCTEDGWRTFAFISDLPLDPKVAVGLYGWRWRIETANREIKHFLALTTSRDMKLRRVYYRLAAFLYNLWIALRHWRGRLTKHGFKREVLGFFSFWFEASTGIKPPPG